MNNHFAIKSEGQLSEIEIGPQVLKVEIKTEMEEETANLETEYETFPPFEEVELKETSLNIKTEVENTDINNEAFIGENFVASVNSESKVELSEEYSVGLYIPNQCSQQKEEKDVTCKQFKCPICNKSFSRKVGLRHLRIHSDEKPFNCFVSHLRIHSDEKQFECSVCKKSFTFQSSLIRHLHIHSNEKPFKCSVCEKAFYQKEQLYSHLHTHSNEKPFKCSLCNMSFKQKGNLNIHFRNIHNNDKPFKCSICNNKSFSQKSSLNTHLRIHNNEKPFKCSFC
ncbi:hypothetical protein L9F63_011635, partial [Diploptera punctata]